MPKKDGKVFAVVDYENMRHNVHLVDHEALGPWLMSHLVRLGSLAFAFVIVDVTLVDQDEARSLTESGFILIHSPKSRIISRGQQKDTVDPNAVEVIHRVLAECPEVTTLALASGDRDFNPALQTWKQRGRRIIILGHGGVSRVLRENAHQVYDLRPTAQQALDDFRRSLRECKTSEQFGEIRHPSVEMIRDEVARCFREVAQQYYRSDRAEHVTRLFLIRRLQKHFPAWEQPDVEHLVDALVETVLDVHHGVEGRWYTLEEFHPFVRYALDALPAALNASHTT